MPILTRHLATTPRPWTPQQAFRHCEQLTHEHYENFPVASLLIPREKRKHVCAIYAFARTADDFADEPGYTPAERIENLNNWEEQLLECYSGSAHHPVFVALRETIDRFEIPQYLFQNLLLAFRSDVTTHRYETYDEVLEYCSNSANPVGRIVLLLFNYRSEAMMKRSDSICTALQLTNFWQDVSVDLEKNRVYIPLEDLHEFGYSERELFDRKFTRAFQDMMVSQVERTKQLFAEGKPLLDEVGRDLAFELKLTWHGGMSILKKIERLEYNVLARRPKLSTLNKFKLLFSARAL